MRKIMTILASLLLLVLVTACGGGTEPTPEAAASPKAGTSPTPTTAPSASLTPIAEPGASPVAIPEPGAPPQWPMYGYDLQRSGRVPYRGPDQPAAKWGIATESWLHFGSWLSFGWLGTPLLLIGGDSSIYIRLDQQAGALTNLNPDGSLRVALERKGTPFAVGVDGTIYSDGGGILASPPGGEARYISRERDHQGALTVTPDGTVYSATGDGLYALRPDGSVNWEFLTGGRVTLPAVAPDGTIYFGAQDGNLYALTPEGTLKWKFAAPGVPVVAPDGTVYVRSMEQGLHAINPDGSLKWLYEERDIHHEPSRTFYGVNVIASEPAVGQDGIVYIGTALGLSAVNPDGSLKWRYVIDHPGGYEGEVRAKPITDANGTVYVVSRDWNLYAVSSDGNLKWKFCLGGSPYGDPVMAADGTLYVAAFLEPDHGKLWAISSPAAAGPTPMPVAGLAPGGPWPMLGHDPERSSRSPYVGPAEPEVKWVFTAGEINDSAIVGPDGTVYFGTVKELYAVDPAGNLKWRFDPGRGQNVSAPAMASDGTIFLASGIDFYILYPDMTVKEEFRLEAGLNPPMIAPDGTVYFGGGDGYLYAYDPMVGFKWRYPTLRREAFSNPAIASDGTIYLVSPDENVHAVNADGTLKWKYTYTGSMSRVWPAVGLDGTVYFYARDICAINPEGALRWKSEHHLRAPQAIASDGTIYVDGQVDYFYAISPEGSVRWKFDKDFPFEHMSNPAIDSQGTVYFGSDHKQLYAVNSDGSLKWKLELEDEVGPPVIGADGTIYVPVKGGKLYAISSK